MGEKKESIKDVETEAYWEPPFNSLTNFSLLGYVLDVFCPDEDGECQVIKVD